MMIIYVFYNCHCRSRNDKYSTCMVVNINSIIIIGIINHIFFIIIIIDNDLIESSLNI